MKLRLVFIEVSNNLDNQHSGKVSDANSSAKLDLKYVDGKKYMIEILLLH